MPFEVRINQSLAVIFVKDSNCSVLGRHNCHVDDMSAVNAASYLCLARQCHYVIARQYVSISCEIVCLYFTKMDMFI